MNRQAACAFGFIIALWSLIVAPSVKSASEPLLATSDWSVKAADDLAASPPAKSDVLALLNELWSDRSGFDADDLETFRFVDLRRSGTLSLVIQQPGSRCEDGEVDVIDKDSSGFAIYSISENRFEADEIIQDLKGDGHLELVVDGTYVFQDCADYDAVFPVIYTWTGGGYADVSDRFPGFYRHRLQTLKSRLDKIKAKEQAIAANGEERWPTCPDLQDAPTPSPQDKETPAPMSARGPSINYFSVDGGRFNVTAQSAVCRSLCN